MHYGLPDDKSPVSSNFVRNMDARRTRSHAALTSVADGEAMAPATADLLAGIPTAHLSGLAGGIALPALAVLTRRRLDVLAILLLSTAGVHLGLAAGHARTSPVLAVLFVLDGLAYLVLVALPRRRWWRPAAAALLLGTILAYLVYVGIGREASEPVGVADKLLEVVALGLVLHPRRGRAGRWKTASAATFAVALLTGVAMWIEDLAGAAHVHGAAATCAPNHHPGPGTVLRPVPCTVTPEQQAAADRLVAETRQGIAPFQDVRVALAAGYRPSGSDGSGTTHYTDFRAHAALDTRHPAALVYASTRHGPVLLGAMYQMPNQGQAGPDIGGALTPWHYHTNVCISLPGLLISGLATPFGQCPPGSVRITTSDQLHVWTAPNPNGPFGDLDQAWVRRLAAS